MVKWLQPKHYFDTLDFKLLELQTLDTIDALKHSKHLIVSMDTANLLNDTFLRVSDICNKAVATLLSHRSTCTNLSTVITTENIHRFKGFVSFDVFNTASIHVHASCVTSVFSEKLGESTRANRVSVKSEWGKECFSKHSHNSC